MYSIRRSQSGHSIQRNQSRNRSHRGMLLLLIIDVIVFIINVGRSSHKRKRSHDGHSSHSIRSDTSHSCF